MILIPAMKIVDEAMRKYFESLVAFRTASLVSSLTANQASLMARKDQLTPEEMDAALDALYDLQQRVALLR